MVRFFDSTSTRYRYNVQNHGLGIVQVAEETKFILVFDINRECNRNKSVPKTYWVMTNELETNGNYRKDSNDINVDSVNTLLAQNKFWVRIS